MSLSTLRQLRHTRNIPVVKVHDEEPFDHVNWKPRCCWSRCQWPATLLPSRSQKLAIMQQLLQAVCRSRTHNLPVLLAVAAKSRPIQNGLSTSSGSSTWPARLSAASIRVVASCRNLSLLFCTAQIYLKIHGCCASSTGALVLVIAPLVRLGRIGYFTTKATSLLCITKILSDHEIFYHENLL